MPAEAAVLKPRTGNQQVAGNQLAEMLGAPISVPLRGRHHSRGDGYLLTVAFMLTYAISGLAIRAHLASKNL